MNIKIPTSITLYLPRPLYAFDKSTEEIELEPPNAKNVTCCIIRDVMASSVAVRFIEERIYACDLRTRKIGILVAFDCVIRKRVRDS